MDDEQKLQRKDLQGIYLTTRKVVTTSTGNTAAAIVAAGRKIVRMWNDANEGLAMLDIAVRSALAAAARWANLTWDRRGEGILLMVCVFVLALLFGQGFSSDPTGDNPPMDADTSSISLTKVMSQLDGELELWKGLEISEMPESAEIFESAEIVEDSELKFLKSTVYGRCVGDVDGKGEDDGDGHGEGEENKDDNEDDGEGEGENDEDEDEDYNDNDVKEDDDEDIAERKK